jgi:outer membrane murein-binding lipoprotein Lpp
MTTRSAEVGWLKWVLGAACTILFAVVMWLATTASGSMSAMQAKLDALKDKVSEMRSDVDNLKFRVQQLERRVNPAPWNWQGPQKP